MDTQVYNASGHKDTRMIAVGYKTDKGRKRSGNEDSYAVFGRDDLSGRLEGLFVVADGMGGAKGGEIASNLVINKLPDEVQTGIAMLTDRDAPNELAGLLERSIQRANGEVWNYKQEHEGFQHMGTTCVAAMITQALGRDKSAQGFLVLANVGDSRAYLLREGKLSQITEDHSTVWEQVKAGKMTPEQAATSRFRNEITRAMGLRSTVKPDISILPLQTGDVILLCSDGLTVEVDDATVARLLAGSPDPQIACDRLVEAALTNGGSDNITVVTLHYGAFTPLDAATHTREPLENVWEPEEEDVTDPNQVWKRSLASGRDSQRATSTGREERYVSSGHDRYSEDVAVPRRGVSSLLFSLLLFVALAEGAGLYLFWSGKLQPKTSVMKPQPVVVEPTAKSLNYLKPTVLYAQSKLWEGALHVMPDGRLLVVTMAGEELAISPVGTPTLLGTAAVTPVSLVKPVLRQDGSVKSVPILPMLAVDASGNRYEFNPARRAIDKYDAAGVIVAHIREGELKSIANLAVDKSGNIYVIDSQHLKKIAAVADTGQAASSSGAGVSPTTPTTNQVPNDSKPPVETPTHE